MRRLQRSKLLELSHGFVKRVFQIEAWFKPQFSATGTGVHALACYLKRPFMHAQVENWRVAVYSFVPWIYEQEQRSER